MSKLSNTAAWQVSAKSRPFKVDSAPIVDPETHEILVRNQAVAINPLDADLQATARFPMDYPTIFGQDVAGEVVAIGSGVNRFATGDRVVGHAVGLVTKRVQENAFQLFTVLNAHMASPIPKDFSCERAAVLPLGVSTAACGLFQDAPFLGLNYPTSPSKPANGKTILVWGGSSSVGSNAIQLARAAGYEVIATASLKNSEYVKGLGASQVFDYSSPSIASDLENALKGKDLAGAFDSIGGTACSICVNTVHRIAGKGAVATTKGFGTADDTLPEGVTMKRIFGTTLKDNGVGKAIYEDFLPKALESGSFVPSPSPHIVGTGLQAIQEACDEMAKGVSAKKLVVKL